MFLADEDVWNRSLVGDLLESVLDGCAVVYSKMSVVVRYGRVSGIQHTDLVKLDGVVLCTQLAQEGLCSLAVWAV